MAREKLLAKSKVSRSSKAGLQFPVGRIARYLKKGKFATRIGAGAPVYLVSPCWFAVDRVTDTSAAQVAQLPVLNLTLQTEILHTVVTTGSLSDINSVSCLCL